MDCRSEDRKIVGELKGEVGASWIGFDFLF
jgi:hypothetical protein